MIYTCLIIFLARIFDVTLGTIRSVYTVKGKEIISSLFAFFEVLVWFYVAKSALTSNDNSFLIALFYSLGYACGTFIGTFMAKVMINKYVNVRIILSSNALQFYSYLEKYDFKKSIYDIKDNIYYIDLPRKNLKILKKITLFYDKNAKIILSDIKYL